MSFVGVGVDEKTDVNKTVMYSASTKAFGNSKDCVIIELFGNVPLGKRNKYYNNPSEFPEQFRISFHEDEICLYDDNGVFLHKISYEDTGFYIIEAFFKCIAVPIDPTRSDSK